MPGYGITLKNNNNNILISNEAKSLHYLGGSRVAERYSVITALHAKLGIASGHESIYGGVFIYKLPNMVYTMTPILIFIAPGNSNTAYAWTDHYVDDDGVLIVEVTYDNVESAPPRILVFSTLENSVEFKTGNIGSSYGVQVMYSSGEVAYDSRFTPLSIVGTAVFSQNSSAADYETNSFYGNYGDAVTVDNNVTAFSYRALAYGTESISSTKKKEYVCYTCGSLNIFCNDRYQKVTYLSQWWSYYKAGLIMNKGQFVTPKWVQQAKLSRQVSKKSKCAAKLTGWWDILTEGLSGLFSFDMEAFVNAFTSNIAYAFSRLRGTYLQGTRLTKNASGNTAILIDSGIYQEYPDAPVGTPIVVFSSSVEQGSLLVVPIDAISYSFGTSDIVSLTADNGTAATYDATSISITPNETFTGETLVTVHTVNSNIGSGAYPLASAFNISVTSISKPHEVVLTAPDYTMAFISNYNTTQAIELVTDHDIANLDLVVQCPDSDNFNLISSEIRAYGDNKACVITSNNVDGAEINVSIWIKDTGALAEAKLLPCLAYDSPIVSVESDGYTFTTDLGTWYYTKEDIDPDSTPVGPLSSVKRFEKKLTYGSSDHIVLATGSLKIRVHAAHSAFAREDTTSAYMIAGESFIGGGVYVVDAEDILTLLGVTQQYSDRTISDVSCTRGHVAFNAQTALYTITLDYMYDGEFVISANTAVSNRATKAICSMRFKRPPASGGNGTTLCIPRTGNPNIHPSEYGTTIKWSDIISPSITHHEYGQYSIKPDGANDVVYLGTTAAATKSYTVGDLTIEYSETHLTIYTTSATAIPAFDSGNVLNVDFIIDGYFGPLKFTIPIVSMGYISNSNYPYAGSAHVSIVTSKVYLDFESSVDYTREHTEAVVITNERDVLVGDSIMGRLTVKNTLPNMDLILRPILYYNANPGSGRMLLMAPSILDYGINTMEIRLLGYEALSYVLPGEVAGNGYISDLSAADYLGGENNVSYEKGESVYLQKCVSTSGGWGGSPGTDSIPYFTNIRRLPEFSDIGEVFIDRNIDRCNIRSVAGELVISPVEIKVRVSEGRSMVYEQVYNINDYTDPGSFMIEWSRFSSADVRQVTQSAYVKPYLPFLYFTDGVTPQAFTAYYMVTYVDSYGVISEVEESIAYEVPTNIIEDIQYPIGRSFVDSTTLVAPYILSSAPVDIPMYCNSKLPCDFSAFYSRTGDLSGTVEYGGAIKASWFDTVGYLDFYLIGGHTAQLVRKARVYKDPEVYTDKQFVALYATSNTTSSSVFSIKPTPLLDGYSMIAGGNPGPGEFSIAIVREGPQYSAPEFLYYEHEADRYTSVVAYYPDNSDPIIGGSHKVTIVVDRQTFDFVTTRTEYVQWVNYTESAYSYPLGTDFSSMQRQYAECNIDRHATVLPDILDYANVASTTSNVWFKEASNGKLEVLPLPGAAGLAVIDTGTEEYVFNIA